MSAEESQSAPDFGNLCRRAFVEAGHGAQLAIRAALAEANGDRAAARTALDAMISHLSTATSLAREALGRHLQEDE